MHHSLHTLLHNRLMRDRETAPNTGSAAATISNALSNATRSAISTDAITAVVIVVAAAAAAPAAAAALAAAATSCCPAASCARKLHHPKTSNFNLTKSITFFLFLHHVLFFL